MKKRKFNTLFLWFTYIVFVLAITSIVLASCNTTKGYNYSKHYRKVETKKKMNRLFDLDKCKKNNHAYKH